MLTRSRASNQGVTVEQAMSAYIDAHRRPRHGQGDQQPPNGGNVAPLPVPDGAADTRSADHDAPSTTTTTATAATQPSLIPANEMEGDDEAPSDSDSELHPNSDDYSESESDDFQIPSKEDVAGFLGLPREAGPIGFAKLVGEMSVDEAVVCYALPPEHLEELRKKVSNKLAQVPWPRMAPRNVLSYGKRQVDNILIQQEECIRLMMALMMADQPDIAAAVGLSSLVCIEKLRADRVRQAVLAEVPESTPEPLRMFPPEEQAAINRKIAMAHSNPRRGKFFRGTAKAGQRRQQQTTTSQQAQRGRSRSRAPRNEGQGRPAPNGQSPHHL